MKEGEGIMKWLAIVIIIIIIAIILVLVVFLPILIEKVKADTDIGLNDFAIDIQIGNPVAVLNLPSRLTEFKTQRATAQVTLVEAPFISEFGQVMIAVRDLERLLPASIKWCSSNRNITVRIPAGVISTTNLIFDLTSKEYFIKNNRAFITLSNLSKILKISQLIWSPETKGIRLIWYNN